MDETNRDKRAKLEDYPVLKKYDDVFVEIPGLPLWRDIEFLIDLMPKATQVSMTSYRMRTIELKG